MRTPSGPARTRGAIGARTPRRVSPGWERESGVDVLTELDASASAARSARGRLMHVDVHARVILAAPDRFRIVAGEQIHVRHPAEDARHESPSHGRASVTRGDLEPFRGGGGVG